MNKPSNDCAKNETFRDGRVGKAFDILFAMLQKIYLNVTIDEPVQFDVVVILAEWID